ncbi:LysR family transcriptional regulator, partial [Phenylobacterium sp.]|uniref:LysR family transcriptional regulator n=1 Tax=Phenylobacterium sp. TaxID=1871053 RepID=UPI00345BE77A
MTATPMRGRAKERIGPRLCIGKIIICSSAIHYRMASSASSGSSPSPPPSPPPPIRNGLDWSSVRDFLAVAEAGSLSGAARRLGVSQPTLSRRIAALEESLHLELFRRSPTGLELTEAGEALLEPARQMERGAQAVEVTASGRDLELAGPVRITTTDGLAVEWLTPNLADLRDRYPRIDFEVIIRLNAVDLLRREADIAIRMGRPRQADLTARRVGELALGLYASRAYLERFGVPEDTDALAGHRSVGFDEGDLYGGTGGVVDRLSGEATPAYRCNTLAGQLAAIRAGFGIGGQSCFI